MHLRSVVVALSSEYNKRIEVFCNLFKLLSCFHFSWNQLAKMPSPEAMRLFVKTLEVSVLKGACSTFQHSKDMWAKFLSLNLYYLYYFYLLWYNFDLLLTSACGCAIVIARGA